MEFKYCITDINNISNTFCDQPVCVTVDDDTSGVQIISNLPSVSEKQIVKVEVVTLNDNKISSKC